MAAYVAKDPANAGAGNLDTGKVKVTLLKIETDTNQPVPPDGSSTTTRRVYFSGIDSNSPPGDVFGYFEWDSAVSPGWITLLVSSMDGSFVTITTGGGVAVSLECQQHYLLKKVTTPPTISIDPQNTMTLHSLVTKVIP